ncbi:MAG: hypothetical protein ACOY3P_10420 [Planctomycetota bacterium]
MALFSLLAVVSGPAALAADDGVRPTDAEKEATPKTDAFVRLLNDDRGEPQALQTSIASYAPRDCGQDGPTVDLVSAVHVGDSSYYAALNEELAKYDVVLYELVAPEGTRVAKGGGSKSSHPVGVLQRAMKDMLKLELQLDLIDYSAAHFVHADMSPEQLMQSMRDRNDSVWSMMLRMMAAGLAQQDQQTSDVELLMALLNPNRAWALKRVMARQMRAMDGAMQALEGPNGSTIIADRNKVALDVLRRQIDAGKQKIAIFYGAAHMPDFHKRLGEQFGLAPLNSRWLDAWDLRAPGERAKPQSQRAPEKKRREKVAIGSEAPASVGTE